MTSSDTAHELSADVRAGSRLASEVLDRTLLRIDSDDRELNAFLTLMRGSARREAAALDRRRDGGDELGILAGVPVAVKDNICVAHSPTTCGSKLLEHWNPPYNATVIARLRSAGAVVVGKTNLDEFGMGSTTERSAFGATRNPCRNDRVPGGSSGGSAAAVAAGFVPIALGSDTGGSIRQPAAFCGVVGLKPTYGAISRFGLVAYASSLDHVGIIASNIADLSLAFAVLAGHDPHDSTSLPDRAIAAESNADIISGLRVGVLTELIGDGVQADVRRAVNMALNSLASGGAQHKELTLPSTRYGLAAYYLIATAEASSNLARFDGVRYGMRVEGPTADAMTTATRTAGFGDEVKRRIILGTYALAAGYRDAYYDRALRARTLIRNEFDRAFTDVDVIISPTTPTTAFPFGMHAEDPLQMYLNDVCTVSANLTGYPALTVPFGFDGDGLPIGVQIMGAANSEHLLMTVASFLQDAAELA